MPARHSISLQLSLELHVSNFGELDDCINDTKKGRWPVMRTYIREDRPNMTRSKPSSTLGAKVYEHRFWIHTLFVADSFYHVLVVRYGIHVDHSHPTLFVTDSLGFMLEGINDLSDAVCRWLFVGLLYRFVWCSYTFAPCMNGSVK